MGLLPDFADVIHDWVDPDEERMPFGAEASYYENLAHPYSAKNGPMDSIDELLLLKGFTPEIYYGLETADNIKETGLVKNNKGSVEFSIDSFLQEDKDKEKDLREKNIETRQIGKEDNRRLDNYFRVHGNNADFTHEHNKININTASYRVISALTEKMSDDIVTEIINRRMDKPFKSVDEIKDLFTNDDEFLTLKKYLTVKSYIFKITVTATVDDSSVKIVTYYNRDQKKFLYWSEE
jgi:type II secretory pathway component PulK